MDSLKNLAVPKNSIVLVTGANGLVGSHVADQFLEHGYRVRGTVRDVEKNAWLLKLFDEKYGKGRFELYRIPDMTVEGAYKEVIQEVSIVAHTASILSLDPNPHNVIPVSIAGAVNALRAAYNEVSVKRFVFTSSSSAAILPGFDKPGVVVTEDTWNEDSIQDAWREPPYNPDRAASVYAASKTQSEQEVWKYHKANHDKRPDLVVNTILPNFNFGKVLDPANQGFPSSSGRPVDLWKGEIGLVHRIVAPQYFIDTEDTGRLHVAAAILPYVKEKRIFGFAERFSWDLILDILRKHEPHRQFPENFNGGEDPNEIQPRDKAEQLLRDLGRPGWTSLEESVLRNVESLRAIEA